LHFDYAAAKTNQPKKIVFAAQVEEARANQICECFRKYCWQHVALANRPAAIGRSWRCSLSLPNRQQMRQPGTAQSPSLERLLCWVWIPNPKTGSADHGQNDGQVWRLESLGF